ncbi:MAG: GntR family transcriptional regulator [Victivallales bacterium]|nr:GntR family transcriptional regulator [Victivallales bacterium]
MIATKRQMLVELLREKVQAGEFPDGLLPGERELASLFQVGRGTVRSALAVLAEGGWIERRRRLGTRVKGNGGQSERGLAGLIMRSSGHLHGDWRRALTACFTTAGFSVHGVSTSSIQRDRNRRRITMEQSIRKLLQANPEVLVLDGYLINSVPCVRDILARHPILIDFFDSGRPCEATGVWFDYRQAGYLVGRHLLDCGCRKPLLVSGFVPWSVRFNPAAWVHHKDKLVIDGFRRAMVEGGIDPETSIVCCTAETVEKHKKILWKISQDKRCLPDGFCGGSDTITISFIRELQGSWGAVPAGIRLCGIGNTPWSQGKGPVPFPSVDLNADGLAESVVQQALLPPEQRRDIFIEPRLISRKG